jgi:type I restriction enzyme S subunit
MVICASNSYYEKMLATGEVKCIDEEIPFDIPQGWEWCRLRELCTVFGRIGFRGYTRNDIVEKGFGAITLSPSNMQDNGNMNYSVVSYISWKKYEESPEIKVKANDVLIVKTGSSYGKTCIISDLPEKATINPQIAVLKYSFVNNQWLTYFLNAPFAQEQFRKYVIGTSIPTFSQEKLSSTLLPLPPKNEQEHLTKKLSLLDKCIGSYNVIQQLIDRLNADIYDKLKKSILQEAIQGKLVPQIAKEGTAQELLGEIQTEKQKMVKDGKLKKSALATSTIFKGDDNKYYEQIEDEPVCIDNFLPFQIPETWTWCKVKDLLEIQTGASFKKEQANTHNEGVRILRGGNILPNRYIFKDDDVFVAKEFVNENTLLKRNSIITPAVTSLENIGKMAVIEKDYNNVSAGGFVFIISPYIQEFTHSLLLAYFLQSPSLIETMQGITKKSGAAFYNLGKERLKELYIPLPPRKEQQRIVAQIEKLFEQLR